MRYFLIAGEVSGDKLGAALMAGLKTLDPTAEFFGIGGELMRAEGLDSLFDMTELSLMGIVEVLPKYLHLKRRIRQTADHVVEISPDALITIDSPDFCLRVARLVKAAGQTRTIHYVAPSVWAWRARRAEKMARVVDHVLALLPFEPPYMQATGMGCDFVGHPVVAEPVATRAEAAAFRATRGIGPDVPLVLALPGSRRGEVERLSPVFGAALRKLLETRPQARILVPAAAPVAARVQELIATWPGAPILMDPRGRNTDEFQTDKRAAFRAADIALAASGTVSLELAAAQTPMVIAYDMNWLSRRIIARLLRVDTVTLVNLVSETRAVPEFLGPDCQSEKIAAGLVATLDNPGTQRSAMNLTLDRLGMGQEAPGLRAARAVLAAIG